MGKLLGTFGITMFLFWLFTIGTAIYGLVLAFSESIILGIISLFITPACFIYGLVAYFGTNIPLVLQEWIKFPA